MVDMLSIEFSGMSNICHNFGVMESIISWNVHKIEWKNKAGEN